MKEELEKILAKYGNYQTVKKDWEKYEGAEQFEIVDGNAELLNQAITSIINLVDKDIIGKDEDSGVTSLHSVALKINYKNELRAEQRAKLKGVNNES